MSEHRLIRASAGTGKTHQLALRCLALLCEGARPDELFASTFTVKAAGEIADRLLGWLAKAAVDAKFRDELAQQLGVPLSPEQAHELLERVVSQWQRLSITTLDAFFARLCRSFALELGLPLGWSIGEPHELEALRAEALALVLKANPDSAAESVLLLEKVDSPRSVWTQLDSATRELHAVYLESDEIAWQATIAGAVDDFGALSGRLEAAIAGQKPSHATAMRKDLERLSQRPPDLEAIAAAGLAAKLLAGESSYYKVEIDAAVRAIYADILAATRRFALRRQAERTWTLYRLLSQYDSQLQQLKLKRRRLDFEDLPRVLAISDMLGRLEEVWYRLDIRISHVLLDEFQDTSRLQWSVLRRLVGELVSHADKSLFVVGDRKQSIYRWRGAEPEIFADLTQHAPFDRLRQERLDLSYRSAPEVLAAVDAVFGRLAEHESLRDDLDTARAWASDYHRQRTVHEQMRGHVVLHGADAEAASRRVAVAQFCAQRVVDYLLEHPQADIAVLTRTREALAILRHEFARREVLVSEEGGTRLTRHAAPQLLLSLLRLADHPGDAIARFHLANSPLDDELQLANADERAVEALAGELRRQLLHDGVGHTLSHYARRLADSLSPRSLANVELLIELGHLFDARPTLRPSEFIRFVESKAVEDRQDSRVRLLTMHASKGLQFGVVFICDLDTRWDKKAPRITTYRAHPAGPPTRVRAAADKLLRQLDAEAAADYAAWRDALVREELSLLYVAMTRAEAGLHLCVGNRPDRFSSARLLLDAFGEIGAGESRLWLGDDSAQPIERPQPQGPRPAAVLRLLPSLSRRPGSEESPSAKAGAREQSASDLLTPHSGPLRRGRALHAALAEIGWAEDGLPEAASWLAGMQRREPELSPAELAAARDEFAQLWPRLSASLRRSNYAAPTHELVLWREHAFAWLHEGRLSRGRFDRVVLGFADGACRFAHIVDFKSDALGESDDVLVDRYRVQLASYGEALRARPGFDAAKIRLSLLLAQNGALLDVES